MFCKYVEQDREIKNLFKQRIKEKIEREKLLLEKRIDEEVPKWISWAIKPIAKAKFSWDQDGKETDGFFGEEAVSNALFLWLKRNSILMDDVILEPEKDEFIQIDHLVISNNGIFILETKNWKGAFLGSRKGWKRKEGGRWVKCKSPTTQNERHERLFRVWLKDNFPDEYEKIEKFIYPLVVMKGTDWVKTDGTTMPVVLGGIEAAVYINRTEGGNIPDDLINRIVERIKYAKPYEEKPEKKIKFEEGKTREGKRFVRIFGNQKDAEIVAEIYRKKNFKVKKIFPDKKEKGVFFFYFE